MKFIEIRFSPEAKHALKWLHTWLGIAAASAQIVYDQLDSLQGVVSPRALHFITAGLVALMVFNSMRKKA